MTEITTIFMQMNVEQMLEIASETDADSKEIKELLSSMKKRFEIEDEMMETFANFAHINTIEEMMELGMDGVRYGNCENAYDNLYRLAKKCFRGNENREHFASSTLYYFWQKFAFDKGLMAKRIISNGVETIEPIGEKADIFKRA